MLPKTFTEESLFNIFAQYGELKEVHIIRGPDGASKGCAFIKFVDREAAYVAIEDMNEAIPTVLNLLFLDFSSLYFYFC
jgi:CUG-BP- and ETR3-like factor